MTAEGSKSGSARFGAPAFKGPSLFGNLQVAGSPGIHPSGSKSEMCFPLGGAPKHRRGRGSLAHEKDDPHLQQQKAPSHLDRSSMMSRFSFMSANTVFLQYRSNQIYFQALQQQQAAFDAEIAEMEKMMQQSSGDEERGYEINSEEENKEDSRVRSSESGVKRRLSETWAGPADKDKYRNQDSARDKKATKSAQDQTEEVEMGTVGNTDKNVGYDVVNKINRDIKVIRGQKTHSQLLSKEKISKKL